MTQTIQASKDVARLFYVGFPPDAVKALNAMWPASMAWHATEPSYLTVRIAFSKTDQQAYRRALECHKSQFSPEEAKKFADALDAGWQQGVLFRPWFGEQKTNDLFK